MADVIEDVPAKKSYSTNPSLNQIAEYIEDQARVLQERGWTKDAADLIKWARELREKLHCPAW